jgi:hypothetical protein
MLISYISTATTTETNFYYHYDDTTRTLKKGKRPVEIELPEKLFEFEEE